jgi:hypothetical protein
MFVSAEYATAFYHAKQQQVCSPCTQNLTTPIADFIRVAHHITVETSDSRMSQASFPSHTLVAIQDSSVMMGKEVGRALFSALPIPAGTRILSEIPMIICHPEVNMDHSVAHAKTLKIKPTQYQFSSLVKSFELQMCLAWLRSGRREVDLAKHNLTRVNQLIDPVTWKSNKAVLKDIEAIRSKITSDTPSRKSVVTMTNILSSYTIPVVGPMTGEAGGFAIGGPFLSSMNYSCDPNVMIYTTKIDNQFVLELYALRDIDAFEELVVNFQSNGEFLSYFQRRVTFEDKMGVACACLRCKIQLKEVQTETKSRHLMHFNVNEQMQKVYTPENYKIKELAHHHYMQTLKMRDEIMNMKQKGMKELRNLMAVDRNIHFLEWKNLEEFIFVNETNCDFLNGKVPQGYRVWPWLVCEQLRVCLVRFLGTEVDLGKKVTKPKPGSAADIAGIAAVPLDETDAAIEAKVTNDEEFLKRVFLLLNQYMDLVAQNIVKHNTPALSFWVAFSSVFIQQRLAVSKLTTDADFKAFTESATPRAYALLNKFLRAMRMPHGLASAMLESDVDIIHPSWMAMPLREACDFYDADDAVQEIIKKIESCNTKEEMEPSTTPMELDETTTQ